MQRVESIKGTLLSSAKAEEDPSDVRDADVELTDEKDGAWAEGRAPIGVITEFLGLLEEEETEKAIDLAQKILGFEPNNQLVTSLLKALQLKLVVDQQEDAGESDDDSDDDTSDEDSTDDEDGDDDDDEEHTEAAATDEAAPDAKDVEL